MKKVHWKAALEHYFSPRKNNAFRHCAMLRRRDHNSSLAISEASCAISESRWLYFSLNATQKANHMICAHRSLRIAQVCHRNRQNERAAQCPQPVPDVSKYRPHRPAFIDM